MHFLAQMKVRLNEPLDLEPGEMVRGPQDARPLGYVIIMKVNAENVADAAQLTQAMALAPPGRDGKGRSFDGHVEEATIQAIEPESGPEHVRKLLAPMDQRGVYYKTGLMFFSQEEDEPEVKRWWQFWK